MKSLRSDIASRLYELLGLKFYGVLQHRRRYWRIQYQELCDLLPITIQRYYSDAQRYLAPTHDELRETSFLEKVEWEKESKDTWRIKYYPGKRAKEEFARTHKEFGIPEQLDLALREPEKDQKASGAGERQKRLPESLREPRKEPPREEQGLQTLLTDRGIGKRAAANLTKKHPDRIQEKVEMFDWIQRNQPDMITKNPAGYLRQMIEEDWPAPQGFRTKAQEEETRRKVEERKEAQERRAREGTFRDWQRKSPEEKVAGDLIVWKERMRRENGLYPTEEEEEAKKQELIADLPTEAEMRRKLLGEEK